MRPSTTIGCIAADVRSLHFVSELQLHICQCLQLISLAITSSRPAVLKVMLTWVGMLCAVVDCVACYVLSMN